MLLVKHSFMRLRIVKLWRENLATTNAKAAQSLADPTEYENLFPGLRDAFKTEQYLAPQLRRVIPASKFTQVPVCLALLIYHYYYIKCISATGYKYSFNNVY